MDALLDDQASTAVLPDGLVPILERHGPGSKALRRGTHRTRATADTVDLALGHAAAVGITRVANITGLDHLGIPVVMVVRPNSRGLAVSQGKGLTLDDAKASGLMECIELWHGEHLSIPVFRGSASQLSGRRRVARLERMPRLHGGHLDPALQMLWAAGVDLVSGDEVLVPEELVGTDRTHPRFPGAGCFFASSNGLASGNHPLEAVVHGLCEVVERDAVTLLDFAGEDVQRSRRIDLDSVTDADCRSVLDACEAAGVTVLAWDATSDIGLPVVDCMIVDLADGWRELPPARGQGCHLTREVALLRAVTEAAQDRLTLIAGSRDDTGYEAYRSAADPLLRATARTLAAEPTPVRFEDLPTSPLPTLADDVTAIVDRLVAAGLDEVIVVELTDPELGVPVWRTVVPGLEYVGGELSGYRPGTRGAAALAGHPPRPLR